MRHLVLLVFLLGVVLGGPGCESKRSEEPEKINTPAKNRLQKLKVPKQPSP
jgi:hypothetical protein